MKPIFEGESPSAGAMSSAQTIQISIALANRPVILSVVNRFASESVGEVEGSLSPSLTTA
jgi:hypothetical protein